MASLQEIVGGIHLRYESTCRLFKVLSFGKIGTWDKFHEADVNYLLSEVDVMSEHILLLREMKPDIRHSYEKHRRNKYVKGIIYINTTEDYELPEQELDKLVTDIPVCILKVSTGKKILQALTSTNLYCTIQSTSSSIDEIPEEYDIVYPEKIIASDLKQIKNLLYPKRFKSRIPAKPGPGKDLELFRSVMGVVMQLNVKNMDSSTLETLLNEKMIAKIEHYHLMENDFPFYMAFIGYIDEFWKSVNKFHFISTCKKEVENIDISEALKEFLGRGNFFIDDVNSISAFTLLHKGCLVMLYRSQDLYCNILWTSLALTVNFKDEGNVLSNQDAEKIWKMHVYSKCKGGCFDDNKLKIAQKGIRLIRKLDEPLTDFLPQIVSKMLVESRLPLLKDVHAILGTLFDVGGDKEAAGYSNYFRIQYFSVGLAVKISIDGIKDGMKILFELEEQFKKRGAEFGEFLMKEFNGWIEELVKLALRDTSPSRTLLKEMVKKPARMPARMHTNKVQLEVVSQIEFLVSEEKVHMKDFAPLFVNFPYWSDQFVQHYLENYPLSKFGCILSESHWNSFLQKYSERYKDAEYHRCVLAFFHECVRIYTKKKNFFIDLLKLKTKLLFKTSRNQDTVKRLKEDFNLFLANDVLRCVDVLELDMNIILKLASEEQENYFQELLLSGLQKEILSEYIKKKEDERVHSALRLISKEVSNSTGPSVKSEFCLETVDSLYNDIPTFRTGEDIKLFGDIVLNTATIVRSNFSQWYGLNEPKAMLLPKSQQLNSSAYFRWVTKYLKDILNWKKRLEAEKVCYNEVHEYQNICDFTERLLKMMIPENALKSFSCSNKSLQEAKEKFKHLLDELYGQLIIDVTSEGKKLTGCLVLLLSEYYVIVPGELMEKIECSLDKPLTKILTRESIVLKTNCTLHDLDLLLQSIRKFTAPLEKNLNIFIFFKVHQSSLFHFHLKSNLSHCNKKITMQCFNDAIVNTKKILASILDGTIPYSVLTGNGQLDLYTMNIEQEFKILQFAVEDRIVSGCNQSQLIELKNLLQLFKLAHHIQCLQDIFQKYQLKVISTDPAFIKCYEDTAPYRDEEKKVALKLSDAGSKLNEIKRALCMPIDRKSESLDVLFNIKESPELFKFITDKEFYGDTGLELFRKKYQLITIQLQHMEYDENVLNNLPAAIKITAPFCSFRVSESTEAFKRLMQSINDNLCGSNELQIINRNMSLVQRWFSHANEENIYELLKDIMENGRFKFDVSRVPPFTLVFTTSGDFQSPLERKWMPEDVNDFAIAIQFYEEESLFDANLFKNSLKVAYEIMEKSHEALHLGGTLELSPLYCNTSVEATNNMVQDMISKLQHFTSEVAQYQREYPWLLLISIPKTILVSDLLKKNTSTFNIACEMIYLSKKDLKWEEMELQVEENCSTIKGEIDSLKSPIERVGVFLNRSREAYIDPKRNSFSDDQIFKLCFGFGYTQHQLLSIIRYIYEDRDIIQPHLIFICDSKTTKENLEQLFKRAKVFIDTYTIIGVNFLNFKLQEILVEHLIQYHKYSSDHCVSMIYLIETKPSNIRDIPWVYEFIEMKDVKDLHDETKLAEYYIHHHRDYLNASTFYVMCNAGDGKTHFIYNQIKFNDLHDYIVISVDESFSVFKTISRLRKLYERSNAKEGIGIFFNFTLFKVKDDNGKPVSTALGWFFFHLLVLGYVEDDATGYSFSLLKGIEWNIYIEAPPANSVSREEFINLIPILDYVPAPITIRNVYDINSEAELVCKYLRFYSMKASDTRQAKKLRKSRKSFPSQISKHEDLTIEEGNELMLKYMPDHKSIYSKKLFMQYMYKKCRFLDELQFTNFSMELRDLLMDIILSAVKAFTLSNTCLGIENQSWSSSIKYQIICNKYKKQDEDDNSMFIMCTDPDYITDNLKEKISVMETKTGKWKERFKVVIPKKKSEFKSRDYLLQCISKAFGIDKKDCESLLKESQYVLTADYTMKMLNINECMECKLPVIICGETGVGKTFLIEMISKMWNLSLKTRIEGEQNYLMHSIACTDRSEWKDIAGKFKDNHHLDEEEVISVMKKLDLTQLNELICTQLASNPLWSLLDMPFSVEECKKKVEGSLNFPVEDYSKLIFSLLTSVPKRTFYKLSVHSALTSDAIDSFFEDKIQISKKVSDSSAQLNCDHDMPSVVVLIDEINTSSCGGCLKEIVADKTFHGVELPKNLFVIATCNPHRGNSLIIGSDPSDISQPQMTYFVHDLHPTLKLLMWNFGSLSESEEEDYVYSKLNLVIESGKKATLTSLFTHFITLSQKLIRKYASSYIFNHCLIKQGDAEDLAKSSVSQRDIQRVFSFYFWLLKVYKMRRNVDDPEHRAILVSLGLVYYLRLNSDYRKLYKNEMDKHNSFNRSVSFSKAFEDDIEWLLSNLIIPKGIAKTRALKENLFAIIVCTCNKVPIIVVGKPGTSRTLSFHLAIDNLKGIDSHNELLRNTELFPALDPILYQCSKQTTSYEIDTLFNRAVNRQKTYSGGITCVVFMDEAGLPEESHESLKILHHHLDERNVAFVGISNHVLDAAKTNRAVSIVIPDSSEEDLHILVKGCYDNDAVTSEVIKFCPAYLEIIQDERWRNVFGMRDFIYFIHYLCQQKQVLTPTLVLHALERNFNGTPDFEYICKVFFQHYSAVEFSIRNTFDILNESIREKWDSTIGYGRYKLIFDASEDDSVISFFFKYGILNEQKTHIYISSKLFTEKELQKVNTISAICHSVSKGHTVIMYQTEDIHECFYDLFNLRFRCIEDSSGCRYYTNVAIGGHIKPICVHPDFQCIIVLKQSTFQSIPTPFLNRFEKYMINHKIIILSVLEKYPKGVQHVVNIALKQIQGFVDTIEGSATLYGFRNMTVFSVILLMLPSKLNPYERKKEISHKLFHDDKELFFHVEILKALNQIGIDLIQFHPGIKELSKDASNIFSLLNQNTTFSELYQKIDSPETVYEYIMSAIKVLMSSSDEYPSAIVTGVHLILSYIIQLIIRSLCKCLMQVMTPEGLIVVRKNIPSSYLHSYLYYQDHFSLKGTIKQEMDLVQMELIYGSDASTFMNMQKIQKFIIFCRSSAMIHSLPSNYPSLGNKQTQLFLQNHITSDVACLSIIKVSVIHSQDSFKRKINLFYRDNILKVLLLIIDIQESSPEIINHIRMIVDEAQLINSEVTKQVVLLLHFPSSMFSSGYYPTLFLHGWKYRYIDSLAHNAESGDLDMELLIKNCLVKNLDDSTDPVYDYNSLLSILHHSAGNISPLLTAHFKSNEYITKTDIRHVLTDEDTIALLCKRFLHYLDAGQCLQYLDNAAKAAYERESTINMRSHIEVRIKNNMFKNFLIYVITFFHVHGVTKSLLAVNESLERFIHDLLPSIPVPDIFQLTNGSSYYTQSVVCSECNYECPFFLHIYDEIEKIMDEAMQIVRDNNVQFQFSKENNSLSVIKKKKIELFSAAIHKMKKAIEIGESFFAIAISRMDENVIWQRYFRDFFHEKLNFPITTSGYLHDLMSGLLFDEGAQERESCLGDWNAEYKVPFLIVSLHFQFQIKRSFYKTHSTILKLLNEIDILSGNESSKIQLTSCYTPNELMKNSVKFCLYALDSLFTFFCRPVETVTLNHLKSWNSLYLIMISDAKLVEKLYKIQLSTNQAVLSEKKWNIMHSMHLVFSSCSPDHLYKATTIILKCYSCFINMLHTEQRMDSESQLKSIHEVLSEVLQEDNEYLIKNKIYDKMFEHFLSKSRSSYHFKDIQCFLRISNNESDVHISRSVVAYYLKQLLKSDGHNQEQRFHYKNVRKEIGVSIARHCTPAISLTKLCNARMLEIPVGYLYHVFHMEELLATDRNMVSLLDHEKSLIEEFEAQQTTFEKVLLNIEIQSIIQVIIRTIAEKLSGNKRNVYTVMHRLEGYYDDIRAILEYNEEYTDTLIMHMLEENKSLKIFVQNYEILCDEGILRKRNLNSTLKAPFILSLYESSSSSREYFNDLKFAMVAIADSRSTDCSKELEKLKILKERSFGLKLKIGTKGEIEGEPLFHMTLWLCAYKEFGDKNRKSNLLLQKLAGYVDDKTILLLKTLLDPDTEHFLFRPRDYNKEDEMYKSMRRNVIVMIAVLLGLKPKSNNLWFHLFEPLELMNTFIPGFLSDECLTEDMPYSFGCQLSDAGLYSNYYQYIASKSRNMRPQHIFIILWMNISSLSMCFLTGLIPCEEMQNIIGSHSGMSIFFEQQLNLLWNSMQKYFGLLHEEIDYLLVSMMEKYLEFHSCNVDAVIFNDGESRQKYESSIVHHIIKPGIEAFMNEPPFKSFEVNKSREIECSHVRFLAVTDVQYIVASLADNFASDFLFGFNVLNIISESLHSLNEFYELIHKDLSYRITKDVAEELSIDNLLHQLKNHFPSDEVKNFKQMFKEYMVCSKRFIEVTGDEESRKLFLDGNSKVISLLSTDKEGDYLFKMISNMITFNNKILVDLCGRSSDNPTYHEVQHANSLEMEDLVQRCSLTVKKVRKHPFSIEWSEECIDHSQLESDIKENCMKGRSLLKYNVRYTFKFRSTTAIDIDNIILEVDTLCCNLPVKFRIDLSNDLAGKLRSLFHRKEFAVLKDILTGLLVIARNLSIDYSGVKSTKQYLKHYVEKYLGDDVFTSLSSNTSSCITELIRHDFSEDQRTCLEEIEIGMLFSLIKYFCTWIKEGYCDFWDINLYFKNPLDHKDDEILKNIIYTEHYKEQPKELLKDLTKLESAVINLRSLLLQIYGEIEGPLITLIKQNIGDCDLLDHVPKSIVSKHYVSFHIAIRKLINSTKRVIAIERKGNDGSSPRIWNEWIKDPWAGVYTIQHNEPVVVKEHFMKDTEVSASLKQFHGGDDDDSSSAGSVPMEHEHLSEFEFSDSESIAEPEYMNKPLEDFTRADLSDYFVSMGMTRYVHLIESESIIDGNDLSQMDINDLKEAGVTSNLDQLKIFLSIKNMKLGKRDSSKAQVQPVLQFLQSPNLPGFKKYVPSFRKHGITGEILLRCNVSILNEIGVESVLDASRIIVYCRIYFEDSVYGHEESKERLLSGISLLSLQDKDDFIRKIEENDVSLCMLREGGKELLNEIGIESKRVQVLMRQLKNILKLH